jgi:hypothetical protein
LYRTGADAESWDGVPIRALRAAILRRFVRPASDFMSWINYCKIIITGLALCRPPRKREATLRIPTPGPIFRRFERQPHIWWNNLDSTNESAASTSVLSSHMKKAL